MKKVLIYILVAYCFATLGSCKKFLEESSLDEVRPSTTADLLLLMNGTAYPYQTTMENYIDLLTDDIKCNGIPLLSTGQPNLTYASYLNNGTPLFTWDPTMFDRTATGLINGQDSWQTYYKLINGCNLIADYTGKVTGTDVEKNALLGQVLFLRAFYYLKLVTLYGQPYNRNGIDPSKRPGVPLVLSSVVSDVRLPRNTLAEVYTQIEKDLLESADLLKKNFVAPSPFRVSHIAAYALLSRLYLYMGRDGDMDKVIQYAGDVISSGSYTLTDLKTYFTSATAFSMVGIYDNSASREIIWGYGSNPNSNTSYYPQYNTFSFVNPPFTVSNELANLYDRGVDNNKQGDLRYVAYFWKYSNGAQYPLRSSKIGTGQAYGDRGIRLAEIYLNRAEAYLLRFKKTGQGQDLIQALSDINTLRQNRYDTRNTAYVPVTITNPDALYTFYQEERRRELCLEEGHRWMDIKRWGIPITHIYTDANGVSTNYTLASGSLMYALPIPYTATDNNFNLVQNPR